MPKALRFAQDGARHDGTEGGLIELIVRFYNPKFVDSDDQPGVWQDEGFDACRADHTKQSTHMEWCLKEPSQVEVLKVYRVPVTSPSPVDGIRSVPVGVRRMRNTKDVRDSADGFGRLLAQDLELRKRCGDKQRFKLEFAAWKERELAEGRAYRGAPATVLYKLSQMDDAQCKARGSIRCNVIGSVVHFVDPNDASLAGVAQRVRESRGKLEADKFGIVATPLTYLFAEHSMVDQGVQLQRTLTVHNTSKQPCKLSVGLLNRMNGAHGFSCPSHAEGVWRVIAPGEGAHRNSHYWPSRTS